MQENVTRTEKPVYPFETYLQVYQIDPVVVAALARVRFVSVWNAMKGIPISRSRALSIITAAYRLSGVAYTGKVALLYVPPVETATTQKIHRRYSS